MKIKYWKYLINVPVIILTLISFFICILYNDLKAYDFLCLMPLTFLIVFLIFYNNFYLRHRKNYYFGIVLWISLIVSLFKYVVTPIAIIYQEKALIWGSAYGKWGPTPNDNVMFQGILLECGEIIFVFLVYSIYFYKFTKKKHVTKTENRISANNMFKHKTVIISFCIFALAYILLVNPSELSFSSILSAGSLTDTVTVDKTIEHVGIVVVFKQILLISVFLLALNLIYHKCRQNKVKIILSYVILLLYISMNISSSRWNMLFAIIVGTYLIYLYYGRKSLIYAGIVMIVIIMGLFSITTYKFRYALNSDASVGTIIGMLFGQMQDYFSGPRLVAQSIEVAKNYSGQIGFPTIINDIFGNMPLISGLCDQTNRINGYFCNYNFGNWTNKTLLMPMVGEGYCYLPFMPWLLSMFFAALTIYFDYKQQMTTDLEFKYLYTLEGCWLAFSICLNSQTNWGHFIQVFVMTFIVFKLNRKFTLKLSKNKYCKD